jgi:DNA-binding transcriptional ArsR family regulator
MKTTRFEKQAGKLFSVMGNPFRIKLLLTLGKGEACVCHLEAFLGKRQAFISQHLMALRKAGLLETRREGKYVYYHLSDLDTLDLIRKAGVVAGLEDIQLEEFENPDFLPTCPCPKCVNKTLVKISEIKKMDTSKDGIQI